MRLAGSSLWLAIFIAGALAGVDTLRAGVVINEFVAASNERRLTWDQAGVPRLGAGIAWQEPGFDAGEWLNGRMPAGYGFAGLSTDIASLMPGKARAAYFRKEFEITAEQAAATNMLSLLVQYNDGFIAYLNGREIARGNCGPTNHYVFAQQPAYNPHTVDALIELAIGPAHAWLVPGRNVLAVQAHNADYPSTVASPYLIPYHLATPEFRINAGLRLQGLADLIPPGFEGGLWRYFPGRAEPSGGQIDLGLLAGTFVPPAGEDGDFDTPGAFSDWVELWNDSPAPVHLAGWSLTDDLTVPGKWRFPPGTVLPSNGYLVVLCDSREEANAPAGPAARLHASFKLKEAGGAVALYNAAGTWVDGCEYPGQVAYAAYGRHPTNGMQLVYLLRATPGASNSGPALGARPDPPEFSNAAGKPFPGGLYPAGAATLVLTNAKPDLQIRYTLDGSEPSEWNGTLYTGPVTLVQMNDKTGVVVRAASFVAGCLPSKTRTHTYLFHRPAALTNLPAMILTGDPGRDWYLPQGLLAIKGGSLAPDNAHPVWLAGGDDSYNMVLMAGSPAERELEMEYYFPPGFYPTNQQPLRAGIGARVSYSAYSRPRARMTGAANVSPWANTGYEKASFNLYFTGIFASGGVNYPFFTNYVTKDFNHLRLRAGKNDLWNPFITDELVRRLWLRLGHHGARGLFTTLYVNGVYKGLYNLTERFRQPFFQSHYQSAEDWDLNYSGAWDEGDSSAFSQLLAGLDADLSVPLNWANVTNRLDIDNTADYFLLNIYAATWDWPGNNYVIARERSVGPNSRFRFAVWDAEGAFASVQDIKPVSYNTITSDLLAQSYYILPQIFRRLATSPEFRLRFADRVNRHMFNGGVLDDRDPDGAGSQTSMVMGQLEELVAEVGNPVVYNSGTSLRTNNFHLWVKPLTGRRSYLLGSTSGRMMLRSTGFWPVTEPPQFTPFGGTLPTGTSLSITSAVAVAGQTASIFYTLNGPDPRQEGGGLHSEAIAYSGPLTLDALVRVRARARNDQTGAWSPLTEATYAPDAVRAGAGNLVIAEIMYHPQDAGVAELAAGYNDADDFEFIRLQNVGKAPVDLHGVRFTVGVTFDFTDGAVRYLNPGASVLVVSRPAAFRFRYGEASDAMLAGTYTGNLSNKGEQLRLVDAAGQMLHQVAYLDQDPWPAGADGDGFSLLLRDPSALPDHALPENWTCSRSPGGMPAGIAPAQTFEQWRNACWSAPEVLNGALTAMEADPDHDGVANFLEYAFGTNPHQADPAKTVSAGPAGGVSGGVRVRMELAAGAMDVQQIWEMSPDLQQWAPAADALVLETETVLADGLLARSYLVETSDPAQPFFLRLRLTAREP